MVTYVILGYLVGFSIVIYWRFHKIEDYLENIINEFDRELFEIVKYLHKDLENKGAVTSDEWTVSPEEAEKMYNVALENMRGYHKKE